MPGRVKPPFKHGRSEGSQRGQCLRHRERAGNRAWPTPANLCAPTTVEVMELSLRPFSRCPRGVETWRSCLVAVQRLPAPAVGSCIAVSLGAHG